jgi:hypothetical protein
MNGEQRPSRESLYDLVGLDPAKDFSGRSNLDYA